MGEVTREELAAMTDQELLAYEREHHGDPYMSLLKAKGMPLVAHDNRCVRAFCCVHFDQQAFSRSPLLSARLETSFFPFHRADFLTVMPPGAGPAGVDGREAGGGYRSDRGGRSRG